MEQGPENFIHLWYVINPKGDGILRETRAEGCLGARSSGSLVAGSRSGAVWWFGLVVLAEGIGFHGRDIAVGH